MSQFSSTRRRGLLLAAATAVISGFAVFLNGYAVKVWSPAGDATTYTTVKNLVAALIIGAFAAGMAMRRSPERAGIPAGRRQRLDLAAIAIVGGSLPFVLFFEGLARADSAQAALIHKTLVIWVGVLAVVVLRERIGWPHVTAIGLLVWGQVMISGGPGALAFGTGELMILGATLLWALEVVLAKRILEDVSPTTVAGARMLGGSVVLVLWALVRGATLDWAGVTSTQWLWVVATGVFLSGYVLTWFAALSRAPAIDVTAVLVAGAVITAMLRTTVGDIGLASPVGPALLLIGVVMVSVTSWRSELGSRA